MVSRHRDMKPDNVMVIGDPNSSVGERAKILDFGIAKLRDGGAAGNAVTKDNLLGTPTYMSPEQCRGSSMIEPATDVYSVGIMLYRMIAARPPFVAEGAGEVLAMHMLQEAPPLQRFAPWLADDLAEFVHQLLDKEPALRPAMVVVAQQLAAFSKALEGFIIPEEKADAGKDASPPDAPDPGASQSDPDTGAVMPTLTSNPQPTPQSWPSSRSMPSWQSARSLPSLPDGGGDEEPQRTTQPSMATASGQRQTMAQPKTRPSVLTLVLGGVGVVALVGTLGVWLTGRLGVSRQAGPATGSVVAPLRIHWSLTSLPTGAVVRRAVDGSLLGHTPWEQDRDAVPGNESLIIEAPGYVSQYLSLRCDRETERALVLTKVAPTAETTTEPDKGSKASAPKGKPGHHGEAPNTEDSEGKKTRKPRLKQSDVLED